MREILFRGKIFDNKNWIEGSLIVGRDLESGELIYLIAPLSACYTEVKKVIPETIGQYTGLTDKNGTKVFEGDILKFTDKFSNYEWIGKVEFGNPNAEYNWGFQLVYISGAKPNTDILLWFEMEETGAFSEVIGNIHDNPELLKGE